MTWALVIVADGEIEIDLFTSEPEAEAALWRDVAEHYQDYDLPERDDVTSISTFMNENDLDFIWSIQEVELP